MFCINCGKPLGDEDRFCRYCGTEINYTRAANTAKTEKREPDIKDIEERVRRRSEEIKKKPEKTEDSVRVENIEVMPEREVTFVEEGGVPEESTEVMPDHEVTFTVEDEVREEKEDDDPDKLPTEDMILSQTIKLLKGKS